MTPDDRAPDPMPQDAGVADQALAGALGAGAELPVAGEPVDATPVEHGPIPADDAPLPDAAVALAQAEAEAAEAALATSPFDESSFDLDAPIRTDMTDLAAPATREDLAALAAATQAARPIPRPLVPEADATDPAVGSTGAVGTKARTHRHRAARIMVRIGAFAIAVALFVGGVALGVAAFQRAQPAPTLIGDISTGGVAAPPVVKELTDALASNDSDSLRSAVSGDPYRLLAGEMQSWSMQGVTSVETLATMQDGPRSATEIIITGRTASGMPVVFNLVVHVTDNQIVNFR